jgi:hypothetical protein
LGLGGGLLAVGLVGELGPEERGALAGDRDVGDGRALAAAGGVVPPAVQADLGLPRPIGWLRSLLGAAGSVAVVPGGLDEQPAGVAVPGLGDVAAVLLVTGGVFARRDPEPGGEPSRVAKAAEVADLRDQSQRGPGRDAAERGERRDAIGPRLLGGDLLKVSIETRELAV